MDDPVVDLLQVAFDQEYPDEADRLEDLLESRLGVLRANCLPSSDCRRLRVQAINAAGESADDLARKIERELSLEVDQLQTS